MDLAALDRWLTTPPEYPAPLAAGMLVHGPVHVDDGRWVGCAVML